MMAYPRSRSFSFSAVWEDSDFSFDPPPHPLGMDALLRIVRIVGIVSIRTGDSPTTNSLFQSAIPPANINQIYLATCLEWNKRQQKVEKGHGIKPTTHFNLLPPSPFPFSCQNGPRKALYPVLGTKSMNYLDSVNMHLGSLRSKEDVLILPRI